MNNITTVHRDERTVIVENAGYRWAYLFLSFGLLMVVAFRSFIHHESPWDLLLLVVLAGAVGTLYQGWNRVLSKHWAVASLLAFVLASIIAVVIVWLRT